MGCGSKNLDTEQFPGQVATRLESSCYSTRERRGRIQNGEADAGLHSKVSGSNPATYGEEIHGGPASRSRALFILPNGTTRTLEVLMRRGMSPLCSLRYLRSLIWPCRATLSIRGDTIQTRTRHEESRCFRSGVLRILNIVQLTIKSLCPTRAP